MPLLVTGQWAHFVVWTTKDMRICKVSRDPDWKQNIPKTPGILSGCDAQPSTQVIIRTRISLFFIARKNYLFFGTELD